MYKFIIKVRSAVLVYLTHHVALPFLKLVRKPKPFPFSREQLLQMPENTLGKKLIDMLEEKKLQLLPYYAKHDIKHIILGYDTTDEGEVCLQCFMLGNRHLSFPVAATVAYGFFTMPEHWSVFAKAFERGKQCPPIEGWKWFEILQEPVYKLQHKINTANQ
jgi:ubiquinone biosynthesis protein Coq4